MNMYSTKILIILSMKCEKMDTLNHFDHRASELEKIQIKLLRKQKRSTIILKRFVKVLTASQDEAENIKYFKFLKIFLMMNH